MENNEQKVDLDFVSSRVNANYQDEDVIVISGMPNLPDNKIYKMDMLLCYAIIKGRMQFNLNGNTNDAVKGDVVICLPNSYIDNYMMSPDLTVHVIGISYAVLQRNLNISKQYWNIVKYIAEHPVITLKDNEWQLMSHYSDLFKIKLANPDSAYHKETIQTLLRCVFLEISSIVSPKLEKETENGTLSHGDQIFARFLSLLSVSEGRERSVKAYADKLCITPKYLSTLSKSTSGRPALSWIHQFAAEAIERRLKYSDKTIKEISDEMNFPNLSFFGKFTKAHLGKSPTDYRRSISRVF